MKFIKTVILIVTLSIFTLISYNSANAAVDCSDPKGFHQKMTCKLKGASSSGSSDKPKKPKKEGGSFWDKIKNLEFGGEPVDRS